MSAGGWYGGQVEGHAISNNDMIYIPIIHRYLVSSATQTVSYSFVSSRAAAAGRHLMQYWDRSNIILQNNQWR